MNTKYFCSICKATLSTAPAFIVHRQEHINKGEMKDPNVKSKATVK